MICMIKLKVNVMNIIISIFWKFLDYFEKTYLKSYKIEYWNYYNNIEHITNNSSKSYNNYLKYLFSEKPIFYKLILKLQEEEFLY